MRAEWQNHLPQPASLTSFQAAQDATGFPGCERTLLALASLVLRLFSSTVLTKQDPACGGSDALHWMGLLLACLHT